MQSVLIDELEKELRDALPEGVEVNRKNGWLSIVRDGGYIAVEYPKEFFVYDALDGKVSEYRTGQSLAVTKELILVLLDD